MIIKTQTPADSITWREDFENRINPQLMNQLLWHAVPVLEATEWRLVTVKPGFAESMLPLNHATTNQHGTHQGALVALAADYTGGMAMTTLLRGVPLSGIHPSQPDDSVSLWLASMDVRYLKPSTGHLYGRCQIEPALQEKIVSRYFQGKRVLAPLKIEFESNGEIVAHAELKYFAQPTIQLLDATRRSTLFSQKLKASARMIAGVRAGSQLNWNDDPGIRRVGSRILRVDQPHDTIAAGPHGQLLAAKLKKALPQLTNMVLARTRHVDQSIRATVGLRQVVLLGAGLDMRPFVHGIERPELAFFEIDLPEMLAERKRVIDLLNIKTPVKRISRVADFLVDDIDHVLADCQEFDPKQPTVFVYEGCSMYFSETINRKILKSIYNSMLHPSSKVWVDMVSRAVVDGTTNIPEIANFVGKMDDLGESFIFGQNDPGRFLSEIGFNKAESMSSGDFFRNAGIPNTDPVYEAYQFCVGTR